eukprot:TRINITY_DN51038_c0_g1_i2.p1 TRINITY_DN51038_c0_g1~~TRINITY_DN51038_c0_g1_i2.p1  ORF type:complete len:203 (+),score=12.13 TRINITY_DN51038_c0_g1_i2:578-1186(+)
MGKTHSTKGTKIRPSKISDDTLLAMGRLVRAFAEIEHLATLYLCKVVKISEAQALLLAPRIALTAKIKMIAAATQNRDSEAYEIYKTAFTGDVFETLLAARNVVAHGVFLGLTDDGEMAFRTSTTKGMPEGSIQVDTDAYLPGAFPAFAAMAEDLIPDLEELLKLPSWRSESQERGLHPHSKVQKTRSDKPQRQTQSPKPSK